MSERERERERERDRERERERERERTRHAIATLEPRDLRRQEKFRHNPFYLATSIWQRRS